MSGWVLLCSRRIRLDDLPFLPGSRGQAVAALAGLAEQLERAQKVAGPKGRSATASVA